MLHNRRHPASGAGPGVRMARSQLLPLLLALLLAMAGGSGCTLLVSMQNANADAGPTGDGDGDGDGDPGDGDGDGDPGDGDGDGDGDPGDGDGDGDPGDGDGDGDPGDGDGDGDPGDGDGDGDGDPVVDVAGSSVEADPADGLIANGAAYSTLTVTVLDTAGAPMAGQRVTLRSDSDAAVFTQPVAFTDASGIAVGTVAAVTEASVVVEVLVGPDGGEVPLDATATVDFDRCVTDEQFYEERLQTTVFSRCIGCHNDWGRAPELSPGALAFKWPDDTAATAHNLTWIDTLKFDVPADDGSGNVPYILAKPLGAIAHGGGEVLPPGDEAIDLIYQLIDRLNDDTLCLDETPPDLFEGVELASPTETFRLASFTLTGQIPTAADLEGFGGGENDLDDALDDMLVSDAFEARLIEMYNDFLLTDEALDGAQALNQLPPQDYPNRFYFRPCDEGFNGNACCTAGNCCKDDPARDPAFCEGGQRDDNSNNSIAQEGLELIRHVVKNDLPFTEILTAEYLMVNPYSAAVLGLEHEATFDTDPTNDRYEFVPVAVTPGAGNTLSGPVPQAGLLSTSRFLRRYPTSNTNVNRHRARIVLDRFLGMDVMEFLTLQIDQEEELGDNPFLDARTCSSCHAALDPIAGTFKNYRFGNRYVQRNWFDNNPNGAGIIMRSPGFKDTTLPAAREDDSLVWLGEQLAGEERFARDVARRLVGLLTGQAPVKQPVVADAEDYQAQLWAYRTQNAYFQQLATDFAASGYSLRTLAKTIITGPWYRATGLSAAPSTLQARALEIAEVGGMRLVTPEQLDRKLRGTLGFPYHPAGNSNAANNLLSENRFRLLVGGHDSDVITTRFRDPFPIQASVVRRMANEMACLTVPMEFAWRDANNRRLLRSVEVDTEPLDAMGTEIPANVDAIKTDLAAMHLLLLGEEVSEGDPALEESYDLWVEVWQGGKARVDAGNENGNLYSRCRAIDDFYDGDLDFDPEGSTGPGDRVRIVNDSAYTVRAWMAVMSFMLTDSRFIFER
jgi:hypothetical protein